MVQLDVHKGMFHITARCPRVSAMDNVVDFQAYRQDQWKRFRERAVGWLNPDECRKYYEEMVSWLLVRTHWYQRLMVEEALFETLLDGFCMGLEAGRRHVKLASLQDEIPQDEIDAMFKEHYSLQADESVRRYCNKYHLFALLDEWTWLSLQVVFDDCVQRWFRKGFQIGLRRQKVRQW